MNSNDLKKSYQHKIAGLVRSICEANEMTVDEKSIIDLLESSEQKYPITIKSSEKTSGEIYYIIYANDDGGDKAVSAGLGELDVHVKVSGDSHSK